METLVFLQSSLACSRYDYACAADSFAVVNSCQVLVLRLTCSRCIEAPKEDLFASSLPGALRNNDSVIPNCYTLKKEDLAAATCAGSTQDMIRLCPCVV